MEKYENSYKNNKLKKYGPTWNETFPDASYSATNIQDYFKYIIKLQAAVSDNTKVRIYENQV